MRLKKIKFILYFIPVLSCSVFNVTLADDNLPVITSSELALELIRVYWEFEVKRTPALKKQIIHMCSRQPLRNKTQTIVTENELLTTAIDYSLRKVEKIEHCSNRIKIIEEAIAQNYSSYGFYTRDDDRILCSTGTPTSLYVGSRRNSYPKKLCFIELYKSYKKEKGAGIFYEYRIAHQSLLQIKDTIKEIEESGKKIKESDKEINFRQNEENYFGCDIDRTHYTKEDREPQTGTSPTRVMLNSNSTFGTDIKAKLDILFTQDKLIRFMLVPMKPYFNFRGANLLYGNCTFTPVWNSVYLTYLASVSEAIHEYVKMKSLTVKIYSGTHGSLKYKNNGSDVEIGTRVVPATIWIVLEENQIVTYIFTILNTPNAKADPFEKVKHLPQCSTPCQNLQSKPIIVNNSKTGHIRCCDAAKYDWKELFGVNEAHLKHTLSFGDDQPYAELPEPESPEVYYDRLKMEKKRKVTAVQGDKLETPSKIHQHPDKRG